jgi:hypothetical protein
MAPVRRTFSDPIRRVAAVLALLAVVQFALGVGRASAAASGLGLSFSCGHVNSSADGSAPTAPRHDPGECCLAHCSAFGAALLGEIFFVVPPPPALTDAPAPASGFLTPYPQKTTPTHSPRPPPRAA